MKNTTQQKGFRTPTMDFFWDTLDAFGVIFHKAKVISAAVLTLHQYLYHKATV